MELSAMVGAMARVKIADRDGQWRTIRIPHRIEHEDDFEGLASLERWYWPDGWGSRRGRWSLIPESLHRLKRGMAGWLDIPGVGSVAVCSPSVIPRRRADPFVELTIRIPESAAYGARFDWLRFSRLAVRSAIQARAYLSGVAVIDRTARKGVALVQGDPAAHLAPWLTDAQLARLVGYPPDAPRKARQRARAAFEALAAEGVFDLVAGPKGVRIYGPDPAWAADERV